MPSAVRRTAALAFVIGAIAAPAAAGPPYVTDDPEPTDLHRWEIYTFGAATRVSGATEGAAGLDLNYGGAKDLQLTLVLPVEYAHDRGLHTGVGDVELAAKLKLLHQAEGSALPDVAVFPRLFLPTGTNGFGSKRAGLLLPVWAQKDFGPWSLFGGGGYQINPGAGNRDFWQSGAALTREIRDGVAIGAEVYHQTADTRGGKAFTGLNVGAELKLTDHWTFLASGGPGLQNRREGGDYAVFVALRADY